MHRDKSQTLALEVTSELFKNLHLYGADSGSCTMGHELPEPIAVDIIAFDDHLRIN